MMMKGIDPTRLDVWMESRSRGGGIEDDPDIEDLHVSYNCSCCSIYNCDVLHYFCI